jgi:hypothetical protein
MTHILNRLANHSVVRRTSLFVAALLVTLGFAVIAVDRTFAQAPFPAQVQTDVPRVVGRWSGKTEEDGILTLVVFPAPGRQLTYEFSGGAKEHATGTFTLRGANELDFTAKGEKEAEKWTYSFDENGKLHLKMEEEKPEDEEEYILSRAGQ